MIFILKDLRKVDKRIMKKINNKDNTKKKIIKKPKAPDYFNTFALNKWNELLPIFIEKYNFNTYL